MNISFIDGIPTSHFLKDALKTYGLFLKNRKLPIDLNQTHVEGAFLYIPHGSHTLHIHHTQTADKPVFPRLHLVLGKSAELTLTQTYEQCSVSNYFLDIALEPNAKLQLFDTQLSSDSAELHTSIHATLKKDASFKLFYGTDGAKLSRFSVTAELLEPNSSFCLEGLAMLTGERQTEIHALVDHAAPNCTSRQRIKTVLNGKSKSLFDGKIYVRSEAQKTEAYQLNNNLLLSNTATATTHPNLEIFADDVKASHGATVAQLSDEELFYLRARGIGLTEARGLLAHAFCRELIDMLPEQQPLFEAMERTLHA